MGEDYDYDDRYADDRRSRPRRYGSSGRDFDERDYRDDPRDRDRYDYRDDRRSRWDRREEPKQSGWGVASFVLSLLVGLGLFLVMGCAILIVVERQGNPPPDDSPETMALGFGILACLFAAVMGGVFGLVGVLQPNRKRVFAILGLAFNGLVLLSVLGLFVLGLAAG